MSPRAIGSDPILRIGSFGGRRRRPPCASPACGSSASCEVGLLRRVLVTRVRESAQVVVAVLARHQSQGNQQRAEDDRVGQRRRDPRELLAVLIEQRQRRPQRLAPARRAGSRASPARAAGARPARGTSLPPRPSAAPCSTPRSTARATPWPSGRDAARWHPRSADRAEPQPRRHDDGAEHADGIFLEALVGIADAADQPVTQVLQPADVVDDGERADVVEERVDREVAPERILFGRAERVVVLDQQVARVVAALGWRRAAARSARPRCRGRCSSGTSPLRWPWGRSARGRGGSAGR